MLGVPQNEQGEFRGFTCRGNHNVIDYTNFGLGELNPIRYRSYYYDTETGLYFLKTRYYDPVTGRFISMDNLSYINPDSINGLNLYCYCENNPIMRVDHTGTEWWKFWEWDWGTILDVGITAVSAVVSIAAGIKVGIKTFAKSFMAVAMTGNVLFAPLAAFGTAVVAGVTTAASIFGAINTVVNSIYYNFLSNTQSSLTPTSYHNGYINRWERLDLTRQETKETWYNLNALRYYGEYNVHMYGWFISGWSHKKGIPVFSSIAESSYVADVNGQKWKGGDKWWRNIFYLALGFLGL